jgi:hypothetical protein
VTLPRAARRARGEEALVLSAEPMAAPRPRGRPRKVASPEGPVEVGAALE